MALSFQQQLEQKVLQKKRDAAAQRSDGGQDAATDGDGVGAGGKQPSYIGEVVCGKNETEHTVEPTEVPPMSPTDEAANTAGPTKPSYPLSPTDVASTLVGLDELQLGAPPSMNKEPCDADGANDVAELAAPGVSDATKVNETAEESIPEDLPPGISEQESFYSARDGYSFEDAVPSAKEEGVGGLERPKKQRKPRKLRPKLQPISRDESSGSTDGLGFGDIVTTLSESTSTQGAVLDEPAATTHTLEHLSLEETKPFLGLLFGSQGLYGDEQEAVTSKVLEYAFGGGSVIKGRKSDEVTENTENTASTHAPEHLDQPASDDAHETCQEDEPEAMNEDAPSTETAKLDLKAPIAQLKELCDDTSVSSESSGETAIIEEYLVDSEAIQTEETLLRGQKTTDYDIALADKPNGVADDVEAELALIEKQNEAPPVESEALDIVASILDDVIGRVVERLPPATAVEAGLACDEHETPEPDASQAPPMSDAAAEAPESTDSGSSNVPSLTATKETSEGDVAWTGRIVGLHLPSSSDNTAKPYECRVDPSGFKKNIQRRKGIGGKTSNTGHQGTSSFLPPNQPTSIALDVYLYKGSPDNPVKVRMICDNPSEEVQTVLERLHQVVSTKLGANNEKEGEGRKIPAIGERPSGGIQLQISSYEDCLTFWDNLWDATINVCDLCCGTGQKGVAHESPDEKSTLDGYDKVENVDCLTLGGLLTRASKESVGKYAVSVPSDPNDRASMVKLLLDAYPPTISAVSSSLSFSQGRVFANREIVVEVGLLCASEARVIWFADDEPVGVGSSYTPSELDLGKYLAVVVVPRRPDHNGWECAEAYQFINAVDAFPCTEYDEQLHPDKTENVDGLSKSEGWVRRRKRNSSML